MIELWGLSLSGAVLASVAAGYLAGSVPFGLVLTRLAGKGDIRAIGSGNIGATNVLRTGSRSLAAAVLALDAAKGAAAVLLAGAWGPDAALAAGCGALTGHLFPVWLRLAGGRDLLAAVPLLSAAAAGLLLLLAGWAAGPAWANWAALAGGALVAGAALFAWGGKGVATALGVLAAAAWPVGLAAALTWLAAAFVLRRSSLAALVAMASAPFWAVWFGAEVIWFAAFVAVVVFVRHEGNIRRLVRGDEPRISLSGSDRG